MKGALIFTVGENNEIACNVSGGRGESCLIPAYCNHYRFSFQLSRNVA